MKKLRVVMVVLIASFCVQGTLSAELLAQSGEHSSLLVSTVEINNIQDDKVIPLAELLSELEQEFDATFLFKDRVVANKFVSRGSIKSGKEAGRKLSAILTKLGLTYNQIDEQTFVLLPKHSILKKVGLQEQISGTVTDAESGETLPGVNVLVKGTTTGTATDADGEYELTVSSLQDTLIFSFIGFQTQEVPIAGRTTIDVNLQPQSVIGEELVVVGFGTQKKETLTGSVSIQNSEDLENRPITSSTQAIQGVQGVYVNQAGGQPGRDNATIRIRGRGTLNDNNPLVLVDGIEYSLDNVNPNNIESISVLKDASSAAIYGARAANGVILVTTKSGVGERGFSVHYNNYFGIQQVATWPDVVKDPVRFMELRDQAQRNEGRTTVDYGEELIEEYREGMKTDPYTYPQNDWFDIMFDPAFMHNHNLRFSGGDENYNYSLSLGYLDQKGVLMGTNAKKYSIALNTQVNVTDELTVSALIDGNFDDFNEAVGGTGYVVEHVLKAQGFHPTYLEDGRYADTFIRTPGHNIYRHPIVLASEGTNNFKEQQYLATIQGKYDLSQNLSYTIKAGLTKFDNINRLFEPRTYQYKVKTEEPLQTHNPTQTRHAEQTDINNLNTTLQQLLEWEQTIREGHQVSTLLGFSAESFTESRFFAHREGYVGNELIELNAGAANAAVSGTSGESSLMSFFGRLNYDYNEKYLLEANFRYDGSSKFAEGNKWGLFPSFALGWRIVEESFLENVLWVNDLKIRASWGQLGNERVPSYRYVNLVDLGHDYSFGSEIEAGAAVTQYNDPNITWETTTITNIGIESSFFRNQLGVNLDLFHKRTSDILRQVNIPAQVGDLGGPLRNIGTVDNSGLEIALNHTNSLGDFSYHLSGSLTWIKNEVVDLNEQEIIWEGHRGAGSYIIKEGYPIDSSYLLDAIGFFDSQAEIDNHAFQSNDTKPGYIKYRDVNEDGVINQADRVIGPSLVPEYTYSFNLNLNYKGIQLSANFNGVQNVVTYPAHIAAMPFWYGTAVTKDWITDSWTPENKENAKLPIMTTYEGAVNTNFRNSNFWLKDASYLRLKNLQLSYSLPSSFTERLQIKSAVLFVNGQNLLTFSSMKDFDPEKQLDSSTYYEYPSVKTYTAGFQIEF